MNSFQKINIHIQFILDQTKLFWEQFRSDRQIQEFIQDFFLSGGGDAEQTLGPKNPLKIIDCTDPVGASPPFPDYAVVLL